MRSPHCGQDVLEGRSCDMVFRRFVRRWRRDRSPALAHGALADEAEAFLAGTYVERLRARGESSQILPWMRLNSIAHGPLARVAALAAEVTPQTSEDSLGWDEARALIARDVLELCESGQLDLARLQHAVLVPIELRLVRSGNTTPAAVADQVRGELRRAQS